MIHLFNEFEAENDHGRALSLKARGMVSELVKYCKENDFSLRDANEIISGTVQIEIATAILMAAVAKRKKMQLDKK